jgi:hypothetical protein
MVDLAANIWGDGPSSQPKEPSKRDIRAWGTWIEAFVKGVGSTASRVYLTLADMNADAAGNPPEENAQLGWVVADPDTTKSGIYQWYAGMAKWQYIAPLPYSFIPAEDSGEGTPNAIKATSPVPVSGMALVLLNVYEANTGSPVTVQFNGGPVLTVKTNTGQDVAAGGLPAGVVLLGRQVGSKFQLVSDIASAAIAAAAEVAKVAAQLARDQAVSAASSVQSEQASRAFASANYHPLVGPDFIRTAAYAVAGDGGGALYKRIGADDSTVPMSCKFSITLAGSGAVVWYKLAELAVIVEMCGAKGDDPGNGTGTDDRQAFQDALDFSLRVYMNAAKTYRINGMLKIRRFQQFIGIGNRSASEFLFETGQTGATRLVFTGSGEACLVNKDPTYMLSHGLIRGFVLRANGSYTSMMHFRQMLDFRIEHIGMQTDSLTMHGLVSEKISPTDDSWINSLLNVLVRLPDSSVGRTIDVDWSDSAVENCHFTGGVGGNDNGYGVRWLNNQFERSNYVGLTLTKKGTISVKNTILKGNSFDANKTHGILFDTTGDSSGSYKFGTVVEGNNFRTEDPAGVAGAGAASIGFKNPSANTYKVGPIANNVELTSGVPGYAQNGPWTVPVNGVMNINS